MQPHKKILLIDADETRRGILAYTLGIRNFDVVQCESVERGAAELRSAIFDLILCRSPLPPQEFSEPWRSTPTPFLALLAPDETYLNGPGIVSPSTEDLLNRIKTLTARRRGQKLKFNKLAAA